MRYFKLLALAPFATSLVAGAVIPMSARAGELATRGVEKDTKTPETDTKLPAKGAVPDIKSDAGQVHITSNPFPGAGKKPEADPTAVHSNKGLGGAADPATNKGAAAVDKDLQKQLPATTPACVPDRPTYAKAGKTHGFAGCVAKTKPYTAAIVELASNLPKVTAKVNMTEGLKLYSNAAHETLKAVARFRHVTEIRAKNRHGGISKVIIKLNQLLQVTTDFSGKLKRVTDKTTIGFKDKDHLLSPDVKATFMAIFSDFKSMLDTIVDADGNMTADYHVQLNLFVEKLKAYVDENDKFVKGFIASVRVQLEDIASTIDKAKAKSKAEGLASPGQDDTPTANKLLAPPKKDASDDVPVVKDPAKPVEVKPKDPVDKGSKKGADVTKPITAGTDDASNTPDTHGKKTEPVVKDKKLKPVVKDEKPVDTKPIEPVTKKDKDDDAVKPTVPAPKPKKTDPVVEKPVVKEPVVKEPVVKEPVVKEPVVKEPVVKEPKPVVKDSKPVDAVKPKKAAPDEGTKPVVPATKEENQAKPTVPAAKEQDHSGGVTVHNHSKSDIKTNVNVDGHGKDGGSNVKVNNHSSNHYDTKVDSGGNNVLVNHSSSLSTDLELDNDDDW